jgi:hypothetical protein
MVNCSDADGTHTPAHAHVHVSIHAHFSVLSCSLLRCCLFVWDSKIQGPSRFDRRRQKKPSQAKC